MILNNLILSACHLVLLIVIIYSDLGQGHKTKLLCVPQLMIAVHRYGFGGYKMSIHQKFIFRCFFLCRYINILVVHYFVEIFLTEIEQDIHFSLTESAKRASPSFSLGRTCSNGCWYKPLQYLPMLN